MELSERLLEAAGKGQVDAVRALVELGADVQTQGQGGDTALHLAAEKGHGEVVRALVEVGSAAPEIHWLWSHQSGTTLHMHLGSQRALVEWLPNMHRRHP